jgi:hypothetical protein
VTLFWFFLITVLFFALVFAIYSQRNPHVSAAKFLHEPMAQAAKEKEARRSGSV